MNHYRFILSVKPHHLRPKTVNKLLQRLTLVMSYIEEIVRFGWGSAIRDVLLPEQFRQLCERRHVAIRDADEPIHCRPYQRAHEQLTPYCIKTTNQHHLRVESCKMGPRTYVAGITTSIITSEKGMGNSLGGVTHSRSSISRSPAWFHKSRRNSSLVWCSSSFLACDAARSI